VRRRLAARVARPGVVVSQAIFHQYGRDEYLRRLAHSFWFQFLWRNDRDGLALLGHHHKRIGRAYRARAPGRGLIGEKYQETFASC